MLPQKNIGQGTALDEPTVEPIADWRPSLNSELLDILQNLPGSGNFSRSSSVSSSTVATEATAPAEEPPRKLERPKFKKVTKLNILLAGESGLGKSTFMHSLFNLKPNKCEDPSRDLIYGKAVLDAEQCEQETECGCTVCSPIWPTEETKYTSKREFTIPVENGELLLTVYDTPGLGPDSKKKSREGVRSLLDDLTREPNAQDLRRSGIIHVCLFFLSPHRVKETDLKCMRMIQDYTNIVPILAKADCYTFEELAMFKDRALAYIRLAGVEVFTPKTEVPRVYAIVGHDRQNIGTDRLLRPFATDSPFDNNAVWDLINTHSADLMMAAQTKRETVRQSDVWGFWPLFCVLFILTALMFALCITQLLNVLSR